MPLIEVHMATGRTDEQKKALLAAITESGAVVDRRRPAVYPGVIHEFPPTEYMAGGELLAERNSRT